MWWMWSAPCQWNRPRAPASGSVYNRPPASACYWALMKSRPSECQNDAYGRQYHEVRMFPPNWKSANKNLPLSPCPNHHGSPLLHERNWRVCLYWPKLRQFYCRYVPIYRRLIQSHGPWFAKPPQPRRQNHWANPPPFDAAHPLQSKSLVKQLHLYHLGSYLRLELRFASQIRGNSLRKQLLSDEILVIQ